MIKQKKVFKRHTISRLISIILVACIVWNSGSFLAFAWEQDAHQIINEKAIRNFQKYEKHANKYTNNHVDLNSFVNSPKVTSTSKTSYYHTQEWKRLQTEKHIIHGGYSADEPHLYVSVKHFYNPISSNSSPQLTDLAKYHGIGWDALPATDWALTRNENPYTLMRAMINYKNCMEIASDSAVSSIPVTGDFRDFAGEPKDIKEMRDMYAGKAVRGLGEVLHLVADMTQPAHVRNDAHPKWEITESAITKKAAAALVNEPRRDGLNIYGLGKTTGDIMRGIAYWTNQHFYSEDTMYDPDTEVKPKNGMKPYTSPVFSHFVEKEYKGYPTWFRNYSGLNVPMFRKERDWSFINYRYIITPEFAVQQGRILLPIAVAGCTRTIDLFWPTLELKQDVVEVEVSPEIVKKAEEQKIIEVKQFEANIHIDHLIQKDPQWSEYGLQIHYSGPGELWKIRGSRHRKVTNLEFKNGSVVTFQDPETGEMTEGKPQFILPLGSPKRSHLSGPVVDYTVEMEDALYVKLDAGVQHVTSDPYLFELEKPKILVNTENKTIMPGEKIDLEATVESPPERYRLDWYIVNMNEDTDSLEPPKPIYTSDLILSHKFEKEGIHRVTVKLYDRKRKLVVAEDYMEVVSEFVDLSGGWNLVLTIEKENAIFINFIQLLVKGIIQIFKPLAEANGGTVDDSVVDKFTLVGSTIEYRAQLHKAMENEIYYEGTLEFAGSNTDYFSAADFEFSSVVLAMDKKNLILYAVSVNDYGKTVQTPFLKKGKLTGIRRIDGEFKFPGSFQGTWKATR